MSMRMRYCCKKIHNIKKKSRSYSVGEYAAEWGSQLQTGLAVCRLWEKVADWARKLQPGGVSCRPGEYIADWGSKLQTRGVSCRLRG